MSRRLSKRAKVYRVDDGAPRVVAELPLVTDTRELEWDGRVDGKPAPVGEYLVQVIARDRAGNEATAPAKVPPDRGETRGVPGLTIRAIAAEPPVHPVTAGSKVTINVDARGHAYHWSLRRLGTVPPGRARQGEGEAAAAAHRAGGQLGRLHPQPRGRHAHDADPDPRAVARARADARRPADDDVDRHAAGRRGPRRRAQHVHHRRADQLAARAAPRSPRRPAEERRAGPSAARPRSRQVRPHERPRPRAVALATRVRPPGRAAARRRALDLARLRAPPAPVRARRRPARDDRGRQPAPRHHAARQPDRERGPAPASDAAVGHRSVRRPLPAAPPHRLAGRADADRR